MQRPLRLAGKAALITGGAAGIGAATARLFCAEGAAVLLLDRDAQALGRTRDAIRDDDPHAQVLTLAGDLADEGCAESAVTQAASAFGHLDVLVNNAATRHHGPVADAGAAQWRAVLEVNLLANARLCAAALPWLRRSGRGAVVNVSSCYAVKGRKGMGLYDASKAAMLSLTRTLAAEEAGQGVRVNAVCPGSTLTEFHRARAEAAGTSIDVLRTQRRDTSMLGRWAEPQEVAWPILWLASDEASFITGTTLMVDAGLHAI